MIRQDEYGADPAYAGAEDEGLQVLYLSTYARPERVECVSWRLVGSPFHSFFFQKRE